MTAVDHRRIAALASNRAVHRAFGWLHLHERQLRRWQMEFLAIPAPPFGEAERAAWKRWARPRAGSGCVRPLLRVMRGTADGRCRWSR